MPERSRTVVIDAGHGGTVPVGASSPNNAVGPNGLLEKDLTLDLARRVRGLLSDSANVILTRDSSFNLSLTDRAGHARRNNADLFVSLHWNGTSHPDVDATESWVARTANARSRRFARRVVDRLARITGAPNRGVRERDLGVLVPSRLAGHTGACLIEVAYLSNPLQARRLEQESYLDDLARGIAESIREDLDAGAAEDTYRGAGLAGGFDVPAAAPPALSIQLDKLRIGSTEIALSPDGKGQFEGFVRRPLHTPGEPSSRLDVRVTGRLHVATSATSTRAYDAAKDAKSLPLTGALCWAVVDTSDGVIFAEKTETKAASDGTFTASGTAGMDFVRRLTINAVVDRKAGKRLGGTVVIELIDLEGLLKLVNTYESSRPKTQTHFQFLASLRKVYQGGPKDPLESLFNRTLYRNRSVPALAVPGTADYTKLSRYTVIYAEGTAVHVDGEYVDIGHVLTGIEGAPGQKPDVDDKLGVQSLPKPLRPDLVVTWEGDLASALQSYILEYPDALNKSLPIDINTYLRRQAGDADLLGDIDGINLGASYDPGKSLADHLKPYYGKSSRRRFHDFLKNSAKDLPLKPGTKLLSDQARKNIAIHVNYFLTAASALGKFNSVDPQLVHDMIQPGSPEMDLVVEYFVRFLQDGLSLESRAGVTMQLGTAVSLAAGDGSPFLKRATDDCWAKCKQLLAGVKEPASPSQKSAARAFADTGIRVDANPYAGLTEKKLNAVIRASFESHQMPEVLLALWAKEGSTRMQTAAHLVDQAKSEANAKSLFRSEEYFIALGTDHFIDTTRPVPTGDNVFDSSDAAAPAHEKQFVTQVQALVKAGVLSKDISSAINAELTVTKSGGKFSVEPSVKFYALSLLLADAFFTQLQQMSYPELNLIPIPLNYLHWNMSEASFRAFLKSADLHRQEPAHRVNGSAMSIEQWALHTKPASAEYLQPRTNAIRFLHYIESYRPIFSNSITLIKPGIEDLPRIPANVAEVGPHFDRSYSSPSIALGTGAPADITAYITNPSKESDAGLQAALSLLQRYEPIVTRSKIDFRIMDDKARLYFEPDIDGESIWEGNTPVIHLYQASYDIVANHVTRKSDSVNVHKTIRTIAHEMFHLWRKKNKPEVANPIEPIFQKQVAVQLDKIRQRWVDYVSGNKQEKERMGIPASKTVSVWADIPAAEQKRIEDGAVESDDIKGLFLKTSYLVEEMLTKLEEVPYLLVQDRLGSKSDREGAQDARFRQATLIQRYSEALQRLPKTNADITDKLVEQTRQAMLQFVRNRFPHPKDTKLDSYTTIFFLNAIERGLPPNYVDGRLQAIPKGARV